MLLNDELEPDIISSKEEVKSLQSIDIIKNISEEAIDFDSVKSRNRSTGISI